MNSSRKRYSREFKLEVIRRVQETGRSQAQVAKELGLAPNTLSRWMRRPIEFTQYSSLRYQQRLWERRMMCSMSRRGDCYDNAVIESFFHTLKVERVHWQQYATKQQAIEDVNWWIGTWYNQKRLHSSLGHRPPLEYEQSKKVA